jgi:cobalt-zinc-cadmium efflux system membrane fusion protein
MRTSTIITMVAGTTWLLFVILISTSQAADEDRLPAARASDSATTESADEHQHAEEHADEVKLTAEAVRQHGVTLGTVIRRVLAPTFTAPARVSFNTEAVAHVGSVLNGRAVEIKVKVGDVVNKGDDLLVVESPELGQTQSEYLQKRTDLAVALAAVEPAKHAYERAKKLYDQSQGIALGEVQKREAEMKAAEGNALSAKAAAVAALNRLLLLGMSKDEVKQLEENGTLNPRLSVRSPISGQVIEREVTLGELVSPDKEALAVIADMSTLWVVADVPEAKLNEVTVGSEARVQSAATTRPFIGRVTHIAPQIDTNTRTGKVRIEVSNPKGFRPGMFARAELSGGGEGAAAEPVLAVPDEAVQTVEGSPAVFIPVKGEENTFAKRAISIGTPVGGYVPVVNGLAEGDSIVIGGSFILKADLGKSGAAHEH